MSDPVRTKLEKIFIPFFCFVAYLILRTLKFTYTVKISPSSLENLKKAKNLLPSGSLVYAVWHENCMNIYFSESFGLYGEVAILVSQSKDGDWASTFLRLLGYRVVRGSSSRGGLEARLALIEALKQGHSICLTVDGPRGPRRKPKPGAIEIARTSGVPVIPVYCTASSFKTFNSWDRFQFPLPFSRLELNIGEAFFVPEECQGEDFLLALNDLEKRLLSVEKRPI